MLEQIKENSILLIKGNKYKVKSKVCYFTEKNPTEYYFKIKCEDNTILVISEDLKDVLIGKEVSVGNNFPTPNEVFYKNEVFKQTTSDYQFVKYIEFGAFGNYETECRFIDYINEKETKILSIGIDTYNNKRDDVYASIISINNIQLLS